MSGWSDLEDLVARIEACFVPAGFTVTRGERRYLASGVQDSEFDVVVRGKFGSTQVSWLLECRDRPSRGPAGVEWIEQLYGRRQRADFNKVSAVSTTGFTEGAREAGRELKIDLRSLAQGTLEDLASWMQGTAMEFTHRHIRVKRYHISTPPDLDSALQQSLETIVCRSTSPAQFLKSVVNGVCKSPEEIFQLAVDQSGLHDKLQTADKPRFRVMLGFPPEDQVVIATPLGDVPVEGMLVEGEWVVGPSLVPLASYQTYTEVLTDTQIVGVASFRPLPGGGSQQWFIEFHHKDAGTDVLLVPRTVCRDPGSV